MRVRLGGRRPVRRIESDVAMESLERKTILEAARSLATLEHDYEGALQRIDQILAENPEDIDALMFKGNILDLDERHQEALRCYRYVLDIDPDNVAALIDMGDCHTWLDAYEQAISLTAHSNYSDEADSTVVPRRSVSLHAWVRFLLCGRVVDLRRPAIVNAKQKWFVRGFATRVPNVNSACAVVQAAAESPALAPLRRLLASGGSVGCRPLLVGLVAVLVASLCWDVPFPAAAQHTWAWFAAVSTRNEWWVRQGVAEVVISGEVFSAKLLDEEKEVAISLRGTLKGGTIEATAVRHRTDAPTVQLRGTHRRIKWEKARGGRESIVLTEPGAPAGLTIGLTREITDR